jgi:hypothetical protein
MTDDLDDRGKEPVEIARFLDLRQAEFACSVLEGSGVEAWIDQPFTGSIAPHHMFGSGGIRLLVAAEERERALDVLQSIERGEPDDSGDDDSDGEFE